MMYIKTHKNLFSKETNDGLAILSKCENKIFVLNKQMQLFGSYRARIQKCLWI